MHSGSGSKLETPFLKLDLAGAARATVIVQQPWVLNDGAIRKSSTVPESGIGELERSAQNFAGQPESLTRNASVTGLGGALSMV